jgi:prophage antirepressor-like protein
MKIDKFTKPEFGTLTTITNQKTGVSMFIGKEIAKIWGHTNLTQAIKAAHLNIDEYKVIVLSHYPEFKAQLTNLKLVGGRSSSITLLCESGMYKLALASNMQKAKTFRDWVASEVLPSIRKKGYYSIANQTEKILIHTNTAIQKQNSKDINAKNYIEKGLDSVIEYNRISCILHTGKTPSEIKKIAKNKGMLSAQRTSAKEVLRHTKPELACAMSFTDDLVKKGFDLKTVSELSMKCAVPLFQGMIELGAKPKELTD